MTEDSEVDIIPVQRDHLIKLMNIRNEEGCGKWLRQVGKCHPEGQIHWFQEMIKDPNRFVFSIIYKDEVVGSCGLLNIDWRSGHAEISNFITEKCIGKNIAYIAGKKLLKFAFEELRLHSIWGILLANNEVAIKYNERIGEKFAGRLRERRKIGKEWIDELLYDITEQDYFDKIY